MQLKKEINENQSLRKKATLFIFLTTNSDLVNMPRAYELIVQGYYVKPGSIKELKELLMMIIG